MATILIYGDSNTFGSAPHGGPEEGVRYPTGARWAGRLASALAPEHEAIVEGLPGRTSVFDDPVEGEWRNGLRVLPAVVHSHKPIGLLAMMLGTNDQKRRFGLGAEDIAKGLGRLARAALATGEVGHVLLIAPPLVREAGPLAAMFAGAESRCAGLAEAIAMVAEEEGCAFFDAGAVIGTDPLDGVHLSRDGHAALAGALEPVVRDLL